MKPYTFSMLLSRILKNIGKLFQDSFNPLTDPGREDSCQVVLEWICTQTNTISSMKEFAARFCLNAAIRNPELVCVAKETFVSFLVIYNL